MIKNNSKLVLASQSPRRQELLKEILDKKEETLKNKVKKKGGGLFNISAIDIIKKQEGGFRGWGYTFN